MASDSHVCFQEFSTHQLEKASRFYIKTPEKLIPLTRNRILINSWVTKLKSKYRWTQPGVAVLKDPASLECAIFEDASDFIELGLFDELRKIVLKSPL